MNKRFVDEIKDLINRHSRENQSNTPDFILAKYINKCLENYEEAVSDRDRWFCIKPWREKNLKEIEEER